MFIKKTCNDILVQVYVDDIIFGSTKKILCEQFVKAMQGEFEMSMIRDFNYFLGLQIKQFHNGIYLCQSKYCRELLKKFDMENCKEVSTPIATGCSLDMNENGKDYDQTRFRGLIGSLLYLTVSRPDIMFSICLCARFQAQLKESHYMGAKRILKYLKGTIDVWYPSEVSLNLIGYSNSDFAGCKIDKKSTSGTCHILGSSLISWHSKKQACVALSTADAEYIAAGSCCAQSLWIQQHLSDFVLNLSKIPLFCDNTSAINLTKNPIQHSRTKHIEIRHHFIRNHVIKGDCVIQFVSSENQLADTFTKPLNKERINFLINELGIIDFKNIN